MCIEDELKSFFLTTSLYKEKYINKLSKHQYLQKRYAKKVFIKIFKRHIKKDNSLYLFDEEIFEIYKHIIKNYEIFLKQLDDSKDKFNEDIIKNINGIGDVLESQVKFFYEDNLDKNVNPIRLEKEEIIKKYVRNMYNYIDKNMQPITEYDKDAILKINKNIKTYYENNLIQFFNTINDTEKREKVSFYSDVLEEEREILSSIIKVQIVALEKLCKTEDEKQNILDVLQIIKETYQHTNKSFDELSLKIKTIEPMLTINFAKDDNDTNLLVENSIKNMEKMQKEEKEIYAKCIDEYINSFIQNKHKQIEKSIPKFDSFINNIKKIFVYLYKFILNNKDNITEKQYKDIVDGICESLCIKLENIVEKYEEIPETNSIVNKLDEYIQEEKSENNLENYIINESFYTQNVIEKIAGENTKFKEIKNTIYNYEKYNQEYIKNTILFEISTFYEILYYSVTKLREDDDIQTKNIVIKIDNGEKCIEKVLNIYGIELIKPIPKDKFNAKEQEILMAEKLEGFEKGEIIKVVSYGYKNANDIIKRATIIASK